MFIGVLFPPCKIWSLSGLSTAAEKSAPLQLAEIITPAIIPVWPCKSLPNSTAGVVDSEKIYFPKRIKGPTEYVNRHHYEAQKKSAGVS
jgi:hypothetical protein